MPPVLRSSQEPGTGVSIVPNSMGGHHHHHHINCCTTPSERGDRPQAPDEPDGVALYGIVQFGIFTTTVRFKLGHFVNPNFEANLKLNNPASY